MCAIIIVFKCCSNKFINSHVLLFEDICSQKCKLSLCTTSALRVAKYLPSMSFFFFSYQMCKILVENVYNICIYVYIYKFVCIYFSFLSTLLDAYFTYNMYVSFLSSYNDQYINFRAYFFYRISYLF